MTCDAYRINTLRLEPPSFQPVLIANTPFVYLYILTVAFAGVGCSARSMGRFFARCLDQSVALRSGLSAPAWIPRMSQVLFRCDGTKPASRNRRPGRSMTAHRPGLNALCLVPCDSVTPSLPLTSSPSPHTAHRAARHTSPLAGTDGCRSTARCSAPPTRSHATSRTSA